MKLFVCAVHDAALDAFMQPIFVASEALAVRMFGDEVNRKDDKNPMSNHPADFNLWKLAVFDDSNGSFEVDAKLLFRGKDAVMS